MAERVTTAAILRISDADTLRLIGEYEREPALWHTRHRHYRARRQRLAAADRIARKLAIPHFTGKHVITKFKNLRNSYCQELKKIALSLAEGVQDADMYRPRVFWFSKMDAFIRPHLLPPRSKLFQYPFILDDPMEKDEGKPLEYSGEDSFGSIGSAFEVTGVGVGSETGAGGGEPGEEWGVMSPVRPEEVLGLPAGLLPVPVRTAAPLLLAMPLTEPLDAPLDAPPGSSPQAPLEPPEPQLQQADSQQRDTDEEDEEDEPLAKRSKRSKQKKYRPQTYFDQTLSAKMLKKISKLLDQLVRTGEDSFDSFGKYVASMMRGLPRAQALTVQLRVVELLTGAAGAAGAVGEGEGEVEEEEQQWGEGEETAGADI